ncbi:CaiB/BaiF CoA-transferase family protein [Mycobacterium sp.]|uniref:CaiB/BaiF CoA-transferase family protein n=1 Tax=Mycobacterium sp. TaxID=1785 RepID=UPI0039C9B6AA
MLGSALPLSGVRVLDLAGSDADEVGRLFADLGADVLKIEPPAGSPARAARPAVAGIGVRFALHNANKRSAILDPDDDADRRTFVDLVSAADILVDSGIVGRAAAFGASCAELARRFGHLVALSVSEFGATGPYASWRATDPVLYAMSTALSRSGPPTGTPVLPPDGIASATAAVQAAWAALAAYYNRLRSGRGDYIDFSRFESVLQAFDPPFGAMGQAASGQRLSDTWRGRPRNQDVYPIFACKDGYVRICVLSPRQWHGMRAWLGEPGVFQDPKYETLGARFSASREIGALTARLFADQTMDALVAAGQSYGVPIAAVLTPSEALSSEHFRAAGAMRRLELAPGTNVTAPVGAFVVDGNRAGIRRPAPSPGEHKPSWLPAPRPASGAAGPSHRPFDGIRILDLGIIVAGGELGRLFADLGAEVIKVESAAYPDGLRQTRRGHPMSETFAWTHRNEYGLGLDLRQPAGAEIFRRLVADADAVFANFKPGTLASLGLSYDVLREINPRIVLAESSAFGDRGPWSVRMGYGPLVRAGTGITRLWTSAVTGAFHDTVTIFPDHVVARITAIAALATLIRRERTGTGGHVHISQAEVGVNQLDTRYATDAARDTGLPVDDDGSYHGVYPCAGDDEWCVISICDDDDRRALAVVIGRPSLSRDELDAEIAAWTSSLDKATLTATLQRAGIAAGPMNRPVDVLDDPQVRHRRLYTDMVHPLFDKPLPTETGPAPYLRIPRSELRPAPMPGEHTREVCQKLLGLDTDQIERLTADGVLFAAASPTAPRSSP